VGLYNRKDIMEERFDRCVKKYEGCMEQLTKAEKLLQDIIIVMHEMDIHFGILEEVNKYFEKSKYNECANERSIDEDTRLQPKLKRDG